MRYSYLNQPHDFRLSAACDVHLRGQMRYSYLMTVCDREPEVLLSTIRALSRCDMSDSEVIVVNDGSIMDYGWVQAAMRHRLRHVDHRWIDIGDYEAFRIGGVYNGPSRAFNTALDAARGENVIVMSSDTLVGPRVVERLRRVDLGEMAWTPMVLDLESSAQYCGPMRLFPAPWCLAASRKACIDIGGWDEEYLKGMCYEDNDFIGRLVLHVGRFMGDWTVIVYHQSHDQPAYNLKDPEVMAANDRNREYTKSKWSGIPFHPEYVPFDVLRKPHPSGDIVHECRYVGTLLADTIAATRGLIADRVKV